MSEAGEKVGMSKLCSQSLGMFYRPTQVREFSCGEVDFAVGCGEVDFAVGWAEGESAGGLIGTEHNGIFLICLSDKRLVFTRHMKSPYPDHMGHRLAVMCEIERIQNLSKDALESFISTRGTAYNPFADRRRRKKALKGDLNVRKEYRATDFSDGRWLTASDKRTIVHDLEKLLVARIYGGRCFARSRFSKRLYQLLSGPYGHIAHYNKDGFYEAQLFDRRTCNLNCKMIAEGRSMWGATFNATTTHIIDLDLVYALKAVAKSYVDKNYID